MLSASKNIILTIIDFFHRPFARWIDTQTFRYLACGCTNVAINIGVFFVCYHFIFYQKVIRLPFHTFSDYEAAFIVAFCISTPIGFILSRHVVFTESNLRGRVQLFRYLLLVGTCLLLSAILLKFFVSFCGIFPTVATIMTNGLVALFSYLSQRHFTFKVREEAA